MPNQLCAAHGRSPADHYHDDPTCYGELWECPGCGSTVCAGYGAADDLPGHCDTCWVKEHPKEAAAAA